MVYLSGASLPRLSWKKAIEPDAVVVVVVVVVVVMVVVVTVAVGVGVVVVNPASFLKFWLVL